MANAQASARWLQAQQALAAGNMMTARKYLVATLESDPRNTFARVLLAGVALSEDRQQEATSHLLDAAQRLPADAGMICRVAQGLLRVGEVVVARECLQHAAIARCCDGRTLATLAHVWQQIGDHPAALALMDRARGCGFDNPDFRYFRSIQLQFNGRIDEARQELERCLRMGPTFGRASLTLARLGRQTPDSHHLDFIRAQLPCVTPGGEDHAAFEFAQYKELEDLGEYPQAWQALQRANAIMHRRLDYDGGAQQRQLAALTALCDRGFLQLQDIRHEGAMPIFIIGLPRSGTTLLDRILGNHSQVVSAGELGDFGRQLRWLADRNGQVLLDDVLIERLPVLDYAQVGRRYLAQTQWRAGGRGRYIDKLPPNYLIAGLIAKALPQATILHMVRDPVDVCFSNYRALFGDMYPYSYDPDSLAGHYRNYRQLMAHWHEVMPGRILDVRYADLVRDPEAVTRDVFAHCGLDFEPGCTELSRNTAPVATLSSPQVRDSIHARTLGEWERYAEGLAPLRHALADLPLP